MSGKAVRVAMLGAGDFAVPLWRALAGAEGIEVAGVAVQPDRPAGRGGKEMRACALRRAAAAAGVETKPAGDVNAKEFLDVLKGWKPDVTVVADFGQKLGEEVLAVAPTVNVHPSLLPKYRGASPIQWTLANGDAETGVCVLYVTERMDAGDVLEEAREAVRAEDDAESLEARLAEIGGRLLVKAVRAVAAGTAKGRAQDEAAATRARKLKKEDGRVDWGRMGAEEIANRWRGFKAWPGLFTTLPDGRLLKLMSAEAAGDAGGAAPGTVLGADGRGLAVAAAGGTAVRFAEVQAEGKRRMRGDEFWRGSGLKAGDVLGMARGE